MGTMIRPTARPSRFGFTLVELLIVVVILALLIALLLPAIQGAIRKAYEAAVSSEESQLSQALADFQNKFGDYPPSRILLSENGYYNTAAVTQLYTTTAAGQGADITDGQLAQRSITYLRKFFPKVQLSTSAPIFAAGSTVWYDFNGNGVFDGTYMIQGDECLTFFLGGIPVLTTANGANTFGMTGFDKNPPNPFTNSIVGNTMYGANRYPPLFEFKNDRLADLSSNLNNIPSYYDTLGTNKPYVYFSSYGGNAYDPNDVNYPEPDSTGTVPITARAFLVNFPVQSDALNSTYATPTSLSYSPAPNPYTSSAAVPATGTTTATTFQKPQSYQLISAGRDGLYGVAGQYNATTSSTQLFPLDSYINTTDPTIRQREYDNITNIKNGSLQ
jgi:general secretion pathway protein G